MINIIIQKIVTDRRPHDNADDFSSTFGMAVGTVFQNFNDLSRLKNIERETKDLKEQYEKLLAEKNALENEVQKLRIVPSQLELEAQSQQNNQFKKENDSLRDVLKTSKETIAMLQDRLAEVEKSENTNRHALVSEEQLKNPERKSMDERVNIKFGLKLLKLTAYYHHSGYRQDRPHHGFMIRHIKVLLEIQLFFHSTCSFLSLVRTRTKRSDL